MQNRLVPLIMDGSKNVLLQWRRISEQPQRLVAMAGKDDAVESFRPIGPAAVTSPHFDPIRKAADRFHRRLEPDSITEGMHQRFNIALRAAGDDPPGGSFIDRQHSVVFKKLTR